MGRASKLGSLDLDAVTQLMDSELDADRRFFRRRPHRKHRVRRVFPAEFEHVRRMGHDIPKSDKRVFVAIQQVRPGARLRFFFVGPRDFETDLPETEARAWVEWAMGVNT